MINGVTRHSLEIAKLHPCLCSWNKLENVYRTLYSAYRYPANAQNDDTVDDTFRKYSGTEMDYFQTIDEDNMKQTSDMLRAEPLLVKSKLLEKVQEYDDLER